MIEVYDRATGEVVDSLDLDEKTFLVWWTQNGNSRDYGYRVKEDS